MQPCRVRVPSAGTNRIRFHGFLSASRHERRPRPARTCEESIAPCPTGRIAASEQETAETFWESIRIRFRHQDPQDDVGENARKGDREDRHDHIQQANIARRPAQPVRDPTTHAADHSIRTGSMQRIAGARRHETQVYRQRSGVWRKPDPYRSNRIRHRLHAAGHAQRVGSRH